MEAIDKLISIAQDINLLSEAAQLSFIKQKYSNENCELILPLVGEFSAGKTSLINALTDTKQLETATKPTTATVYEIHFGSDSCYAEVYNEDGEKRRVDNLSALKNEYLSDSLVVNVYDTASRIPSNIILVDTPGLSSTDNRHKQTLVDFLPKADAILLVVDVNQQITRSLTDFINMMSLAHRPVFLVITKCDTKAPSELDDVKRYIAENCHLPLSMVVCVSAAKGNVEELYSLLDGIQAEKGKILAQVNKQRVKEIVRLMIQHIDELLKASSSDKELEETILQQELELKKIKHTIERVINSAKDKIEDEERCVERKFQDLVLERLDAVAASKSNNFNAEAVAVINHLASICLNEFKYNVERIISDKASEVEKADGAIPLQSLHHIETSQLSVSSLSYNLDLDAIGHEYDGKIATCVKVAAAAAVVAAVVASAGTAAPVAGEVLAAGGEAAAVAETAGVAETALSAGSLIETVDIVSDVGSIISNERNISRIKDAMWLAEKTSEQYDNIVQINENMGQKVGAKKGLVEGIVGFVTDQTMGKPQRRRAIRIYIDDTLAPQFKNMMRNNSRMVIDCISKNLNEEAEVFVTEKKMALESLRKVHKEKKDAYLQRINQFREYKNELLTL